MKKKKYTIPHTEVIHTMLITPLAASLTQNVTNATPEDNRSTEMGEIEEGDGTDLGAKGFPGVWDGWDE